MPSSGLEGLKPRLPLNKTYLSSDSLTIKPNAHLVLLKYLHSLEYSPFKSCINLPLFLALEQLHFVAKIPLN